MTDTDQDRLILDSVERFLEREVKPHVHALEHDDIYPEEIVEGMKELGLFGATIGAEHGGLGLSATTYARIVEIVSTVWMSLSGIFNSHLIMAAAVAVSLEAMRIHGGYGYSKEFNVERLYRDAPLLVIGEGTNELQRIIIARQLIARNRV